MSYLNELITTASNGLQAEELLERLAVVAHKMKFVDKVPVCFLDSLGQPNLTLSDFAEAAGAVLTTVPAEAMYVIFYEQGNQLLDDLIRVAPVLLADEWPAVKFDRICILADNYQFNNAEDAVALVEDIAEMTHPGFFVFGYEGDKWIRFSV